MRMWRRRRITRWAALTAALVPVICTLLLAACNVSGPTSTSCANAPCPPPILRLPATGVTDVKTLDPPNATDSYSEQYVELIFPGLVVLDNNLAAIPWAASALPTVSSNGLTWTFKVRPGLKWSDGAPITADTYAYSMNRAENPCNAFGAAYHLYAIKDAAAFNAETCDAATGKITGPVQTLIGDSIIATDPQTLTVTLAAPATYFLYATTYPTSYAVPERLISQYGAKWTDHLPDNGGFGGDMFKVTQWNHVGDLILKRNPNFWGVKPTLDEVDVSFYRDVPSAYADFQTGRLDVGYAPQAQLPQAMKHTTFHQIAVQQIDYYAMNWKQAPFNDLRMRQAFAIALNKQALAQTDGNGAVIATNHLIPLGTPGYNPNLLGPDGTTSLTGNIALANKLAAEYATSTHCGTATDFSKCPPVTLTIGIQSPNRQAEAKAALAMWLTAMPKYPIRISSPCDFGCLLMTTSSTTYLQFWQLAWVEDYPDPQDWLSTNLTCASLYNSGSACDPEADALLNAADANPDQFARLQEYREAEQMLVTDVAWLPLDQATTWWETGPKLQGFTIAADGLIPRDSWQTMDIAA